MGKRNLASKVNKNANLALGISVLIVFIGATYLWYAPQKVQDIVPMGEKFVVFYIDEGFHEYDQSVDIGLVEELNDLWCIRLHSVGFFFYTGDYALEYPEVRIAITSRGGFIHSIHDDGISYQILDRDAVARIMVELEQSDKVD